jgi:hypothetical protein
MPQDTMLEAFVPDFSGLSSPAWAPLLSGPRERAAEAREFLQMTDYELDRDDYLKIFGEASDYAKQCTELAKSFCDIFAIHLAVKLGIPHGVRFARYDHAFDRVVALAPLRTVRWILDRCGEKRHRSLDGLKPREFEALWDFAPEAGDLQSEAVTRAMRMMGPPRSANCCVRSAIPGSRRRRSGRSRSMRRHSRSRTRSIRTNTGPRGSAADARSTRSRPVARRTRRCAHARDTDNRPRLIGRRPLAIGPHRLATPFGRSHLRDDPETRRRRGHYRS